MTPAHPRLLPGLATAITMLLWASAFVVIRAVAAHYGPGAMAAGRLLVGTAALSAVAVVRRRPPPLSRAPRGRPVVLVLGYGVLWFGIYALCVNAAERYLDAGTAALLINVGSILIAVFAGVFLGEGLPRALVAGLAIAFTGVALIAVATSTGRHDPPGVLLALAAAVLYAAAVLLQKQALVHIRPFSATWLGCATGAAVCLPFVPELIREAGTAPLSATIGIVYLGLFPTAVAFATWSYALAHTSAGRLSSSSYLVPGLAVLMSWLVLDEVPTPLALVGGALCVAGVAVARIPNSAPIARRAGRAVSDVVRVREG
jgi:drug/metabolite transporter (DMT)-like permease